MSEATKPITRAELEAAAAQLSMFIKLDDLLRRVNGNSGGIGVASNLADAAPYMDMVKVLRAGLNDLEAKDVRSDFRGAWKTYLEAVEPPIRELVIRFSMYQTRADQLKQEKSRVVPIESQLEGFLNHLKTLQSAVINYRRDFRSWLSDGRSSDSSAPSQKSVDDVLNLLSNDASALSATIGKEATTALRDKIKALRNWLNDIDGKVRSYSRSSSSYGSSSRDGLSKSVLKLLPDLLRYFDIPADGSFDEDAPSLTSEPSLEQVVQQELDARRKERASLGASFDPTRRTLSDLFVYSDKARSSGASQVIADLGTDILLTSDELMPFIGNGDLTLGAAYDRLAKPLLHLLVDRTAKQLLVWAKDAEKRDNAAALSTAIQQARQAAASISQVQTELLISASEPQRPPSVAELLRRLSPAGAPALTAALTEDTSGKSGKGSGSGSYGYGSSGRSGSGNGSGSGADDGDPASRLGFLFRRVDPIRVARYLHQAERFVETITKSHPTEQYATLQGNRLDAALTDLNRDAEAAKRGGSTDAAPLVDPIQVQRMQVAVAEGVMRAVRTYVAGIRSAVRSHAVLHHDFVVERHADALRYMEYWRSMPRELVASDRVREQLDQHQEMLKKLAAQARKVITDAHRAAAQKLLDLQRQPPVPLNEKQQAELAEAAVQLGDWTLTEADRVEELYLRGAPSLLESVNEPRVIAMYVLKAVRLLVARVALRFASNVMQRWYRRRVYELDDAPPAPGWLPALALALEAIGLLAVQVVLLVLRALFKQPDNDFVIDGSLLRWWTVDYLATSAAVLVMAVLVAEVVRAKKYFRYKYEGERGLRALEEMTFYIYCVVLPLPLYRLA